MAKKEVVVTNILSNEMIAAGAALVRQLDQARVPLLGAFWFYLKDGDIWRLMLVSPELDTKGGPRKVYERIIAVQEQSPADEMSVPLMDVTVLSDRDPVVDAVRKAGRGRNGDTGVRLFRYYLNGIEDAYVYRFPKRHA